MVSEHGLVGTPSLRRHGKAREPAAGGLAEGLAAEPWVNERSLALVMLQLDLEILGLAVSPKRRFAAFPGAVVPLHAPRPVLVTRPLGKGCHVPDRGSLAEVHPRYGGAVSRSYLGKLL